MSGKKPKQRSFTPLFGAALLVFVSCATAPMTRAASDVPKEHGKMETSAKDERPIVRNQVVESARSLLGQKPDAKVMVRGRPFILDCIGTVSAAWWGAGFDIQQDFPKFSGNGVNRLYKSLNNWGSLHELKDPKPGDIIFWENTYDRNEDGKLGNDGLTHAGLVMEVDSDGTVHYLHESVSRGVVISYFNLLHPNQPKSPNGKIWNSPMFLGSNYDKKTNPPHWLSGDLWAGFGDAEKTANAIK